MTITDMTTFQVRRSRLSVPLITLAFGLFVTTATAQPAWQSIGPEGGAMTAIAVDPTNPQVVYTGTDGGAIYKSVDRGVSWRRSGTEIVPIMPQRHLGAVVAIVVDPAFSGRIYVSISFAGVYQSVNGGDTWSPLILNPTFPDPGVAAIAISPAEPDTVYAGGYVSSDQGRTWTRPLETIYGQQSIAVDPRTAGLAYLADGGVGLFQTVNSGDTYTLLGNAPADVRAVALDPAGTSHLYAGTGAGRIYRSDDRGATWSLVFTLPSSTVLSLVTDPHAPGRVYALTTAGFYHSDDEGELFSPITGLSGLQPLALAVDPTTSSILYAATGTGVLRSADGGSTWGVADGGIAAQHTTAVATDRRVPSTIWVGIDTVPPSVTVSSDSGHTWSLHPLVGADGVVVIATDASSPAILYAAARNDVFRSDDGGVHWTNANSAPFFGLITLGFAADAHVPGLLYRATRTSRGFSSDLLVSRDGGGTWIFSNPGGSESGTSAVAVDSSTGGTAYAVTSTGVWRTTDAGQSWVQTGPVPDFFFLTLSIAVASNPTTLYASGIDSSSHANVRRSTDAGATWSPLDVGRNGGGGRVVVDSATGAIAVAGVGTVSRSTDGGQTWVQLANGLDGRAVTDVALGADPKTVYAAVELSSVYAFTVADGAASQCVTDPTTLCFQGARFEARVTFQSPDGTSSDARAVPLTEDAGALWFFTGNNIELLVKVVDGRLVNGRYWVFVGALSNVAYTITVTDRATGAVRTYSNSTGSLQSLADTDAF